MKVTLLYECFSPFLNCINGTRPRKASHLLLINFTIKQKSNINNYAADNWIFNIRNNLLGNLVDWALWDCMVLDVFNFLNILKYIKCFSITKTKRFFRKYSGFRRLPLVSPRRQITHFAGTKKLIIQGQINLWCRP